MVSVAEWVLNGVDSVGTCWDFPKWQGIWFMPFECILSQHIPNSFSITWSLRTLDALGSWSYRHGWSTTPGLAFVAFLKMAIIWSQYLLSPALGSDLSVPAYLSLENTSTFWKTCWLAHPLYSHVGHYVGRPVTSSPPFCTVSFAQTSVGHDPLAGLVMKSNHHLIISILRKTVQIDLQGERIFARNSQQFTSRLGSDRK